MSSPYSKECPQVRRVQKRRLRLALKRWLKRQDYDAPEAVYRNSQGWTTW